jgi:hypothetical protein
MLFQINSLSNDHYHEHKFQIFIFSFQISGPVKAATTSVAMGSACPPANSVTATTTAGTSQTRSDVPEEFLACCRFDSIFSIKNIRWTDFGQIYSTFQ